MSVFCFFYWSCKYQAPTAATLQQKQPPTKPREALAGAYIMELELELEPELPIIINTTTTLDTPKGKNSSKRAMPHDLVLRQR